MSYQSLALAVAVFSSMHVASADAQSVYVAPGGVYVGSGPVYVIPPPTNGAAPHVAPTNGYDGAQQVVDEHLRLNLLLDIERRSMDDEVAPIQLVLAAPDELGIKVPVARAVDLLRVLLLFFQHGLIFGRGDVLPLGLVVL